MWKKHRFQGLAAEDAEEILAAFRLVTFGVTSCAALLEEAYRLAVTHQRTVYDAMYLALTSLWEGGAHEDPRRETVEPTEVPKGVDARGDSGAPWLAPQVDRCGAEPSYGNAHL